LFLGRPLFSILIILCLLFFHTHDLSAEENFLLVGGDTNQIVVELGPHINERVTPACSFNIALSLMGYDAGILKDEKTPIWDFQEGYDDFLESWKAAQNPQSWMKLSCVWYSKIIGS
jgi:beta-lactamase class D